MSDSTLHQLKRHIGETMLADRFAFRRRLTALENELTRIATEREKRAQETGAIDESALNQYRQKLDRLRHDVDESRKRVEQRRKLVPKICYDSELPVCEKRDEIAKQIREHQVVVICGETGSGKSTQLPKICMELGRGITGLIGHTQPRRIAARSVASRIAEELATPLGQGVGYKIRFTDETGPNTFVKLMTDGILLAESQNDPWFNQYDTIIIDEAHERSLNIDFLLGMLKRVLTRRRDLKLIITSATIDAERFAKHFSDAKGPAPVVEVSGRNWPIDILWRPLDERIDDDPDTKELKEEDIFEQGLLDAVDELARRERGDILIFMPTERDIFETAKLLKHHRIPGDDAARKTEVLPLYARLPSTEQQKIFKPSTWRKIVIATNVAESSLTVPGIRYVIDPGTARISRYSARSRTQRLPIEAISQASADQRAGRCGRIGPGVCIRLYSQQDYAGRERYTTPEIRRTNLASVILQTMSLGLGAIERFPFLDPPGNAAINEGYKTLFEIKAIDAENKITPLGRTLSLLPVDPRIAKMILAAHEENCLREVMIIAAALEIQDPRERPLELQKKADEAHVAFLDETSDFLSYLKLWDFWQHLKDTLSGSQLRKACRQNFLSFNRMREWSDIYLQLMKLVRSVKLIPQSRRTDEKLADCIHRSILSGLLYAIAKKTETPEYTVTGNSKFFLWPGSGLFKKKAGWILAAERLETSKKYLRTVAQINPDWIEPLAAHLLVSTCNDPFWLRETGCVHAYQKVTLFGLVIVPKRRVNFGPIQPERAREIFIQSALVEREFDCTLDFYVKNEERFEEVRRLQAKLRRPQLLASQEAIYKFYDDRIPANVYDLVSLTKWYRSLVAEERKRLYLSLDDLCVDNISTETARNFPDQLETSDGSHIPIDYRFHPGEKDDGLSVTTPPEGLAHLDSRSIGWLVPGLLESKIIALLKSLPKEIRRELVPVPDTARDIFLELEFGQGDLLESLARCVSAKAGRLVTPGDFDTERVPTELTMNIQIVNSKGKILAESRDLAALQKEMGVQASQTIAAVVDSKWHRDGITRWDLGTLPESVTLTRGGMKLTAFPALCDPRLLDEPVSDSAGNSVSLRLFDTREKAARQNRLGHSRLFCLLSKTDLKTQAKWIPDLQKAAVCLKAIPQFDTTVVCCELIGRLAVDMDEMTVPQNEGDFNRIFQTGKKKIGLATQEITRWISQFSTAFHAARLAMEKNRRGPGENAVKDASSQFDRLLAPMFHLKTPWIWLREYPRYFKAIAERFERFSSGGIRQDSEYTYMIENYWAMYDELLEKHQQSGIDDPELETFRWMIEEYRVSLFAQKLGTAVKVSDVRLQKQWEKTIR